MRRVSCLCGRSIHEARLELHLDRCSVIAERTARLMRAVGPGSLKYRLLAATDGEGAY